MCQDCLPLQRQVLSVVAGVRLLPRKQKSYRTLLHRQDTCLRAPGVLFLQMRTATRAPCRMSTSSRWTAAPTPAPVPSRASP
uniref:Uncharacterized protein n=1 Tax=Athene cunicularia TaxID=194338 RepID=A0A663MTB0_ATHCN